MGADNKVSVGFVLSTGRTEQAFLWISTMENMAGWKNAMCPADIEAHVRGISETVGGEFSPINVFS